MDVYQMWPHGYVATATLYASRNVLLCLAEAPQALGVLASSTVANQGHLAVALRTLVTRHVWQTPSSRLLPCCWLADPRLHASYDVRIAPVVYHR